MFVYAIMGRLDYESDDLLEITASEKRAIAATKKRCLDDDSISYDSIYYDTWLLTEFEEG